jgi:mRNA interferase RelE/StbE
VTYKVEMSPVAVKAITAMDKPVRRRVLEAVGDLAGNPRPQGCVQMRGREGWRIRVGKIRVLYEIHDTVLLVTVVDAGYRREIYG